MSRENVNLEKLKKAINSLSDAQHVEIMGIILKYEKKIETKTPGMSVLNVMKKEKATHVNLTHLPLELFEEIVSHVAFIINREKALEEVEKQKDVLIQTIKKEDIETKPFLSFLSKKEI